MCVCVFLCISLCISLRVCVCVCFCVYICVSLYVCVGVCVCTLTEAWIKTPRTCADTCVYFMFIFHVCSVCVWGGYH